MERITWSLWLASRFQVLETQSPKSYVNEIWWGILWEIIGARWIHENGAPQDGIRVTFEGEEDRPELTNQICFARWWPLPSTTWQEVPHQIPRRCWSLCPWISKTMRLIYLFLLDSSVLWIQLYQQKVGLDNSLWPCRILIRFFYI